jgi:hypothetical protein
MLVPEVDRSQYEYCVVWLYKQADSWTSGRSSGRQKDGSPVVLWGQVGKQSGARADVGEK